jgi:tRNA (guanosine-2'-O-)-methyltransferase
VVQFVIAWDAPTADVDLLVTDPKGELSDVGRPTSSGLVKERDCPGRHDECHGKNYENVYLEKDEAKRGTYKVSIRLERLEDEDVPIKVTFGARVGPKVYGAEIDLMAVEQKADLTFEL